VEEAFSSMSNNEVPGVDGIPTELLRCGGHRLAGEVHSLIWEIWETEKSLAEDN